MKIGLVGYPSSGKSTVFGALTGRAVDTGFGAKENVGVVKVHDPRVDALAKLYSPKKTTYAEITFSDLPGGHGDSLDRKALVAMKPMDALCQVWGSASALAGSRPGTSPSAAWRSAPTRSEAWGSGRRRWPTIRTSCAGSGTCSRDNGRLNPEKGFMPSLEDEMNHDPKRIRPAVGALMTVLLVIAAASPALLAADETTAKVDKIFAAWK